MGQQADLAFEINPYLGQSDDEIVGAKGVAQGFLNPPVTTMAVAGMPRSQSGSASGITSTSRQVGTSLGVALAGALTGGIAPIGAAFTDAMNRVWWTDLGLGVLIVVVAWVGTSRLGLRSRERIGHLLVDEA